MKKRLMDWLACPACGEGSLDLTIQSAEERPSYTGHWEPDEVVPGLVTGDHGEGTVTEVMGGTLRCRGCAASYPIVDGIPRLLPPGTEAGPGTGHRWTQFDEAVPEYEQNFLEHSAPLTAPDFTGKLVLDAGCGFGRHAFFAARFGAEVVAIDSSAEAVASAAHNIGGSMRAHVVQGDIDHPPFKRNLFDLVYSYGVLHHVPDARASYRSLHGLVRPGGRLSVWVYGPRQGLTRIVTGALRGATAQMEPGQLHRFSQAIAGAIRVFSHTPHRFFARAPGLGAVVSHLPLHDHSKWPFDVVVADVYDRLRVPVTGYFTGEQLEAWYADSGYLDIRVTRRIRNTESFSASGLRR